MLMLFQVCFVTGVLYTVISFVLGHLLDFADVDGDFDGDICSWDSWAGNMEF